MYHDSAETSVISNNWSQCILIEICDFIWENQAVSEKN